MEFAPKQGAGLTNCGRRDWTKSAIIGNIIYVDIYSTIEQEIGGKIYKPEPFNNDEYPIGVHCHNRGALYGRIHDVECDSENCRCRALSSTSTVK